MINNFNILKPFITFDSPSDFYFLQILKRRKDNPGQTGDVQVIHNYFIYSVEQYESLEEKVIKLCTDNNARAYLRLNKRDDYKIGLQALRKSAQLLADGNHKAIKNVYESVCGEFHHDPLKKWIVDIDNENKLKDMIKEQAGIQNPSQFYENCMKETFEKLDTIEPIGPKILGKIPTKNGYHLITKPFNSTNIPELMFFDIHKDNPTVLFCL